MLSTTGRGQPEKTFSLFTTRRARRMPERRAPINKVRPRSARLALLAVLWLGVSVTGADPRLAAARPGSAATPQEPVAAPAAPLDPAYLERLVVNQKVALKRLARHCYRQYVVESKLNERGQAVKRETRQELICHRDGVPSSRALVINGKPTTVTENESWPVPEPGPEWDRRRKEAATRKSRFDEIVSEIPRAFLFTAVDEQMMDGRRTTLFRLTPNPAYRPTSRTTEMLRHVSGRAWIDIGAAHMVRMEAVVDSDFDLWGGLLLKVRKGATFELRQRPLNDGWVPYFEEQRWQARVAMFKHTGEHQRVERSDFRSALPTILNEP